MSGACSPSVESVRHRKKFGPRHGAVAKLTSQSAGDRSRVLFLNTAHHHAKVIGLDDHSNSRRLEHSAKPLGYLLSQPLLDLETPRIDVHYPRDLRKSDDLAIRDIGNVGLPEKRQHVVLAHRVELDVAHHD